MEKIRQSNKKESFMQGVLVLMISQVFIKLLGLIYKFYLTNKEGFGDAGNAIYNAGFQIYALLLTISSIGVPNAVSKLVSEKISLGDIRGANRIFKIAFFTFAFIGMIGAGILFFGAKYIANLWLEIPEAELTLVALSPSIFFVAIISVLRGYFNGVSSIKTTANSQTLEQLFKTILTILLVEVVVISAGINTRIMAAGANMATTLATVASFIYLLTYYKSYRIKIPQKNDIVENKTVLEIVKSILFVSIPMSLSSILTSINKNIDSFTVVKGLKSIMSESDAKIQYGILAGKVDTLTTLPLSFNIAFATALVPAISAARVKGDLNTAVKRILFSLLITVLIGLPCTIGMILFSEPILYLLFPNASKGAFILQMSSLAIIFTALGQTVNASLQGLGKIFVPAKALTVGVITKLILNLILIPIPQEVFILGGAAGAAFATAVCHIIAFSISFTVLRKNIKLEIKISTFVIKPIIATIIMAICSYATYLILKGIIIERLATIISLILAIIIYFLAIIVLKIFTKEDIYMIPYGSKIYKILQKMKIY